jgi:hypothetical protein
MAEKDFKVKNGIIANGAITGQTLNSRPVAPFSDIGTLGAESVSNPDFSTGPFTGWTVGSGWTYNSGAQHTSGTATLTQSFSITANNPYIVAVTITGASAGSITIGLGVGSASVSGDITATTTTTLLSTSGGSQTLTITPTNDFNGTITAISVKVVNASNSNADFYDAAGSLFAAVRGKTSLVNTAFGVSSLRFNTTGIQNTAFGDSALARNTLGLNNNAFGGLALASNLTGSSNTAIGRSALQENVRGSNNVAIGEAPLYNNISGGVNIAIGSNALFANTTGTNNVAIGGTQTLASNISGTSNIAIGSTALSANTASENTAVGRESLQNNTTGTRNVAVGYRALRSVITGENNVGFGHLAGALNAGSLTTGSNNTFIGYNTGFSTTTQRSGSVAIGSGATVNADNSGVLGTAGMKWSVGGNTAPATTLWVQDTTSAGGVTGLTLRAGSGQLTNSLLTIQANNSNQLLNVNRDGWINIGRIGGSNTIIELPQTNPFQINGFGGNASLVTNGDFLTDLTGWTVTGTDWIKDIGGARHIPGNTTTISQSVTVVVGQTYRIGISMFGRTAGSVSVALGSVSWGGGPIIGNYATYITADSSGTQTLSITPTSDFDGSIRVSMFSPGSVLEIRNATSGSNANPMRSGISFNSGSTNRINGAIWLENQESNVEDSNISFYLRQTGPSSGSSLFNEVFKLVGGGPAILGAPNISNGYAVLSGTRYLISSIGDGFRSSLHMSPTYSCQYKLLNPDFSAGFTNWTAGSGWTSNLGAQHTSGGGTATLTQNLYISAGISYILSVTITGRSTGSITVGLGSAVTGAITATTNTTLNSSVGGLQTLTITPTDDFDGTITNIQISLFVTRHNYIMMNNPVLEGTATLTDACAIRFDAAAGTHKAVDSGTTKTSPGTVDAWVKVNVNGTIHYLPAYTSKTT